MNQNLQRIQGKEFEKFLMVKHYLEQFKAVDGKYFFQDVVLTRFEQGRDTAKNGKHVWVKLVSEAVQSRLENDSSPASKSSSIILNTEGWKTSDINNEFGIEVILSIYKHFQTLLEQAESNKIFSQLLGAKAKSTCATTLSSTYCQKRLKIVLFGTRFFNQVEVFCRILFYC